MAESSPTANWYPDPTGRNELRYWDGSVWTDHVFTQGQQKLDPPVMPTQVDELNPLAIEPAGSFAGTEGVTDDQRGMFARMRENRQARAAGRDEFDAVAVRAAVGDAEAVAALPGVVANARKLYRAGVLEKKLWDTMAVAVRSVIDDDVLSEDEEEHLHRLGDILGTPVQAMEHKNRELFEELVIAGINDGRFPHLPNPGMMLKRGEEAYGSFSASLMKEQAIREYRSGGSSVSIPLGGGVRYRVSGARGRSVVIGTQLVVQDAGLLYVTNQRVLFTGRVKTIEFRNDRLVSLEQFSDGLRLSVSNRQAASLLKMPAPSIAAALITASIAQNE